MTRAARTDVLPVSGLLVGFLALYAAVGAALHRNAPMAFAYLDQLFDADVPSRIIDLTRFAGPHPRTQYHPLFVLFLNPVGVALKALLRALAVEQAGRLAAVLLCAAAGALGVAAFFRLLRRNGIDAGTASAWSVVFGLSASQAFFSVFPESWIFSTLALLFLFGGGEGAAARVAAGVLAFGMAVTNLVAVVLARAPWLDEPAERRSALRKHAAYVLVVLAAAAALSLLQTSLYAGTAPFWRVSGLGRDDRLSFVWPEEARDVVARGAELIAYFLEWNLAAPRTVTHADESRTVVDFPPGGERPFRPAGLVHTFVWGALLTGAIVRGARTHSWRRPIVRALGLWTLALVALHLVFGTSLFLYSGQWTFAVLALAAVAVDPGTGGRMRPVLRAALVLLALLQLQTSSALLVEIARAFPSPAPGAAPAY